VFVEPEPTGALSAAITEDWSLSELAVQTRGEAPVGVVASIRTMWPEMASVRVYTSLASLAMGPNEM
jgi:hypothetical protein